MISFLFSRIETTLVAQKSKLLLPTINHPPLLNHPSFFEGCVGAVFLDGFKAARRNGNSEMLFELRNEDPLFLQVGILPHDAGRIKLRCAGAIRIAAAAERCFLGDRTRFHRFSNVPQSGIVCKWTWTLFFQLPC